MSVILHVFNIVQSKLLYVGFFFNKKCFICVFRINKLTQIIHIYSNKLHVRSCTRTLKVQLTVLTPAFQLFLSFAVTFKILKYQSNENSNLFDSRAILLTKILREVQLCDCKGL